MRASNLENRVVALEQSSSKAVGAVMIVGPYADGDDRAPHFEAAVRRWVKRFGSPPPAGARVLDIILVGITPGSVSGAEIISDAWSEDDHATR